VPSGDEAGGGGEMSPAARRGGIQQQRVQCLSSDADYTSSSEQSCDTVIYVGKNGRMLSDRELTDNEGPPPPTPSKAPQTAAVIPSASSAVHKPTSSVRSSGVLSVMVGGGGLSFSTTASTPDSTEGPQPSLCKVTASTATVIPSCCVVAQRPSTAVRSSGGPGGVVFPLQTVAVSTAVNVAASGPAAGCVVQPCCDDLPHQARANDSRHGELTSVIRTGGDSVERSAAAAADCSAAVKHRKMPASRRVDGATERWIDGPRSGHHVASAADVEAASVAAVIDDGDDGGAAAETWVDGPEEFQNDPGSLVESHRSPMKLLRRSKCAKLYRARAVAVAAAATAAVAGVTPARADCVETTRKDVDVAEWAAERQVSCDHLLSPDPDPTLRCPALLYIVSRSYISEKK